LNSVFEPVTPECSEIYCPLSALVLLEQVDEILDEVAKTAESGVRRHSLAISEAVLGQGAFDSASPLERPGPGL